MRQIRVIAPNGLFHGSKHYAFGDPIDSDERTMSKFVREGLAEAFVSIPVPEKAEEQNPGKRTADEPETLKNKAIEPVEQGERRGRRDGAK